MGAKPQEVFPFECKESGFYVLKTPSDFAVVLDDAGEVIASGSSPLRFFSNRAQTVVIEKYGGLDRPTWWGRLAPNLWRRLNDDRIEFKPKLGFRGGIE